MESTDLALFGIALAVAIFAVKLTIQGRVWINPAETQRAGRQVVIFGVFIFALGIGTALVVSFIPTGDIWRLWAILIVLAISTILGVTTAYALRRAINRPGNAVAANITAEPAAPAGPAAPGQRPAPATVNITVPPSPDKTISITVTIT